MLDLVHTEGRKTALAKSAMIKEAISRLSDGDGRIPEIFRAHVQAGIMMSSCVPVCFFVPPAQCFTSDGEAGEPLAGRFCKAGDLCNIKRRVLLLVKHWFNNHCE